MYVLLSGLVGFSTFACASVGAYVNIGEVWSSSGASLPGLSSMSCLNATTACQCESLCTNSSECHGYSVYNPDSSFCCRLHTAPVCLWEWPTMNRLASATVALGVPSLFAKEQAPAAARQRAVYAYPDYTVRTWKQHAVPPSQVRIVMGDSSVETLARIDDGVSTAIDASTFPYDLVAMDVSLCSDICREEFSTCKVGFYSTSIDGRRTCHLYLITGNEDIAAIRNVKEASSQQTLLYAISPSSHLGHCRRRRTRPVLAFIGGQDSVLRMSLSIGGYPELPYDRSSLFSFTTGQDSTGLALHPNKALLYVLNSGLAPATMIHAMSIEYPSAALVLQQELANGGSGRGPHQGVVTDDGAWLMYVRRTHPIAVEVRALDAQGNLDDNYQSSVNVEDRLYASLATSKCHGPLGGQRGSAVLADTTSIQLNPSRSRAVVVFKGLGSVAWYTYEGGNLQLDTLWTADSCKRPSSLEFFNDTIVYVLQEWPMLVQVLHVDGTGVSVDSSVTLPLRLSTCPNGGFVVGGTGVDMHLHPTRRFLYVATKTCPRYLAMAEVDQTDGRLGSFDYVVPLSAKVSSFSITPDGSRLYVVTYNTDAVIVFDIDLDDGSLEEAGQGFLSENPGDLVWWSPEDMQAPTCV